MKRSKIIEIISHYLDDSPWVVTGRYQDRQKMAKEILYLVEHMGMLPPCTFALQHTCGDHQWEKETFDEGNSR